MEENNKIISKYNHNNSTTDIKIGFSNYTDDIWDLTPLFDYKGIELSKRQIDFKYIHSEEMKIVIKQYTYHLLSKLGPSTVRSKIGEHLKSFIYFCRKKFINSFLEIDSKLMNEFLIHLRDEKKVSPSTGYIYTYVIENLLSTGQIKGWKVSNVLLSDYSKQTKYWIKRLLAEQVERKHPPIPENVFNAILNAAIHKEKNIITRVGIIILSQTGLRISEVLGLKKGCLLSTSDGYTYMKVSTPKTEGEETKPTHKVFVNELVIEAIRELEIVTEPLRKESGLDELFLIRSNGIKVPSKVGFNGTRLKNFIKRWDIRYQDGELYKLTTHQFRVNFVNSLIKKKVPLTFIMKHLNHVSIEMTEYYSRMKHEEIASMVMEIIKPDSKIAGFNANKIKSNLSEKFRGKTEPEINQFIETLSKSMYINPLPTGICLQDSRRGECDNGDGCIFINCPNYITTSEYYPIHKRELELLESEMKRYKESDRLREYQRLKAKWIYLKPIVESLEEEML